MLPITPMARKRPSHLGREMTGTVIDENFIFARGHDVLTPDKKFTPQG